MENLHLCVVTGQSLANLIPLLQECPEHIVLMHTSDKITDAKCFADALEKAGFDKSQIHIHGGLPTHGFDAIRENFLSLYVELTSSFPDARFTWNATGGTKQMALAIWDVLDHKDRKDRVIYSDTRYGFLEELTPKNEAVELKSLLTPDLYLHALGKIKRRAESDKSLWRERAENRKEVTRYLGDKAEILAGLIQQFNRQLNSDSCWHSLNLKWHKRQWKHALELLKQHNVIDPQGEEENTSSFRILDKDAQYLTGGWLEEYIWHVAKDQRVDHVEIGLKFGDLAHRKMGQDNEIDAFIIHRNRLLLMECKSGWMGKDERKDSDIIYKLDSIGQHAGGTQAIRLLVSAQALQHKTTAGRKVDTKARAQANDIHTLEANELKTLGDRIRRWKDSGQWSSE